MEKIFAYITKNLITVIGITILTGTTLTTSALGVMKVANNYEKIKLEVPVVKDIEQTPPIPTSPEGNPNQQVPPHPRAIIPGGRTGSMNTSIIPTLTPSINTATTQSNSSSVQCPITLFGKQYDVTNLRNTHSGGNIFNCNTDMTAVYQARHGTDMTRMQKYLIVSGGTTSNTNTNPTTSGNTGNSTGGSTNGVQIQTVPSNSSSVEIHNNEGQGQKSRGENESETKNDDQNEEQKTHTESYLQRLIQLMVS